MKFRFAIDRGTFTDVFAQTPKGIRLLKLLSVDPANYKDAPTEAIRRIMQEVLERPLPTSKDIPIDLIDCIRMGTTVATNALLERKGEPSALVITKGFADLLMIGNQARPRIFDLKIQKPDLLYKMVVEIDERVILAQPGDMEIDDGFSKVKGISGEYVKILKVPQEDQVRSQLQSVLDAGISSLAIVCIHSYTFPEHEQMIARIATEMGQFTNISLSSSISSMIRAVPRGQTATIDAYLTPAIRRYIENFCSGFKDDLNGVNVLFMQSDGGLTEAASFSGARAIMSGPAGGVVGFVKTSQMYTSPSDSRVGNSHPALIGFDMGGTSTDVSRFAGRFEHILETEIAGVQIQAPQLAVSTVAAGGGSRLFFRSGQFIVGPESASAHPGPICYRKNGYLAVTDANVFLGRVLPQYFPSIFGPSEDMPPDFEASKSAFESLTEEINLYLESQSSSSSIKRMTPEEVAHGFIRVANENMIRPIRNLTVSKGYDSRDHVLASFGGAAPQHAVAIASSLGMKKVIIHKYGSVLSAYGMSLADVVSELQEPSSVIYTPSSLTEIIEPRFTYLKDSVRSDLKRQGFADEHIRIECFLNLRYQGTDFAIMVPQPADNDFRRAFVERYRTEYGFELPLKNILIDDVRVRGCAGQPSSDLSDAYIESLPAVSPPEPMEYSSTYFDTVGRVATPIYNLDSLAGGTRVQGPALIVLGTTSIVVEPHALAEVTALGDVLLHIQYESKEEKKQSEASSSSSSSSVAALPHEEIPVDSIVLSVFANRFMGIAEQMGFTLQRTSISVNIKERLDFSCALFGPDGGLVANAPHLPVHLGSMSEAVRFQIEYLKGDWQDGDVLVANHPAAGGSHLPDITVITPVFHHSSKEPVFFVASRGHHADIGGISPGSMPPFSRWLKEEGVAIFSFKIVKAGIGFQEEAIRTMFAESRNIADNISDLQAQIAANQKGISLVGELISEYSLRVVQAYMYHVQHSAEMAVRDMLCDLSLRRGLKEIETLVAEDYMDDGTPIRLALTIDRVTKSAIFDFAGTGPMVLGNTNAPKSITYSAILYCLRCLINTEIPLNQGCLIPIQVIIPPHSILNPSEDAGVVGGNVLTSMRITDVILEAFGAAANSQGCMNNFTFGSAKLGFYETIAGGAGAGPDWNGASCSQLHMTNTRITDVEIMERRYPVMVRTFARRHGSGGDGQFRGGDGCIREIEFLTDLSIGVLSERRSFAPRGLHGGKDGAKGINVLKRADGLVFNLGGKNVASVTKGDSIEIRTPGGGGWGVPAVSQ